MRKVVYICPNGYLGGAERFVVEAAKGHKLYGEFEPTIIFFSDGAAVERAKNDGTATILLQTKFRLSRPLSLLKALKEIRGYLKQIKPDVIHGTMPYGHIISTLASLFMGIPRVWYQHGPVGGSLDFISHQLPVDQILYNSDYLLREDLKQPRLLWAPKFEKAVVHIGIPQTPTSSSDIERIRSHYLKSESEVLILLAGRICRWKGHDTFISALELVLQKKPELLDKVRTLVIGEATHGEDEVFLKELKQRVNHIGLDERIYFLPFQEKIHSYYAACDVFVHTSKIPEPFGLVVGEAMGQGALVIGSDKGGVEEILRDGDTGLTFRATSETAVDSLYSVLAEVLPRIGVNEELKSLRQRGKAYVKDAFSIQKMTTALEVSYDRVLTQKA